MAGEVEECITHQSNSLPSGSISFGRFDLESLSWERRSSFSHNRYLEEVEKYSTPGSVTKKKEYFEAHFKKKAFLHQVSVENQNETENKHTESITVDNDCIIEDVVCHGNNELVEVSWGDRDDPEHEAVELQKEEMSSAELNTGFPSFNGEKYTKLLNAPLASDGALQSQVGDDGVQLDEGSLCGIVEDKDVDANANDIKLAENKDASSKIRETKKKNKSIQIKSQIDSTKTSDTVEQKSGKSHLPTQEMSKKSSRNGNSVSFGKLKKADKQNTPAKLEKRIPSKVSSPTSTENGNFKIMTSDTVEQKSGKSHLPTQEMSKKSSRNGNSVSFGKLKKADKQNTPAKLEKRIPSKVSSPTSTENGNFKIMASKNMKAKASSEIKSEEVVRAKKAEIPPRPVERRGSDVRQPVNRVKLISKAEDKQISAVFKFKSSERAEKRKEYYLKLEEKLHAKEAEMNEIQARTEEVKEAEMKQFRRSLNFKATPMPSFYHETASKVSEGKKTSTHSKSSTPPVQPPHEKSLPSPTSNQEIISLREPQCSIRPLSPSVSSAAADKAEGGAQTANDSSKRPEGNGTRKKGESKSRMRSGIVGKVKGIDGGNVAVHVAS